MSSRPSRPGASRGTRSPARQRTAIGITGNKGAFDAPVFEGLPGVLEVIPVTHAYKLVSREVKPENTIVDIGGVKVGGDTLVIAAGPCAVESLEQTLIVARAVKKAGAHLLRGGAFKPRTSPYAFQGLGEEGLKILAAAREETGLPVVTEAVDLEGVDLVERYADAIQIGARNMQNFSLLRRAGQGAEARGAEARDVGDPRGVPHVGGVPPVGGELPGRPLRARRADVLGFLAQHPRPGRGAGGEVA